MQALTPAPAVVPPVPAGNVTHEPIPDIEHAVLEHYPSSMTLLTTYRCNAACKECCFESNPHRKGRLSLQQMKRAINEAVESFPALRLVVWSGGECFLLGDELHAAIACASGHGLATRCVTNGFWGRTRRTAQRTVEQLVHAGLTEINFSTGFEHQEWIPVECVIRAAEACTRAGIRTLVTVEKDTPDSACYQRVANDPAIQALLVEMPGLFSLQTNTWMPFHADAVDRGHQAERVIVDKPCDQVLQNFVVTPFAQVSGCCGLTFEYIPEMKLGFLDERPLKELFLSQVGDFLKLWIHMEGPYRIIARLFGEEEAERALANVSHMCQACVILHQHPGVREALLARWQEFLPEIIHRHRIALALRKRAHARALQH